MLSKLSRNGNHAERQPPAPPPVPVRRQTAQISEMAAQAAQHVLDLQAERDDAVTRLADAANHIKLLEERCNFLQADNERLVTERDFHKAKYMQVKTRLQDSAQLVLNAMRDDDPPLNEFAPRSEEEQRIKRAIDNIEHAITEPAPQPAAVEQ